MDNASYDRTIPTTWIDGDPMSLSSEDRDLLHAAFGLAEEAGEVAGKFKRMLRGDSRPNSHELIKELGDCQYYLSTMARLVGYDTSDVMSQNAHKVLDRQRRGVLKGRGDDR